MSRASSCRWSSTASRARGRALFDALDGVVARGLDRPRRADLDLLWYLWCGPRSPLFGKDRITTLENDLVADQATHVETKNPYFQLIHEAPFCDRMLAEFGVDPGARPDRQRPRPGEDRQGRSRRSSAAARRSPSTARSREAYGDHGYTLVLEPERTLLAQAPPLRVGGGGGARRRRHHPDRDRGPALGPAAARGRHRARARRSAAEIGLLERLVAAYRTNALREGGNEST